VDVIRSPVALVFALALALTSAPAVGREAAPPGPGGDPGLAPELQAFAPFIGRTWKAPVGSEGGVYDVARWEVALAGRAVRIVHSVADGAYGGETIVMWNRETESLEFTYFTTAGFLTRGTMSFDAPRRLVVSEEVVGHAGGVREVSVIQELTPSGTLEVRTRKLIGEVWKDADEVVYVEAPDALVSIPATYSETQ
jgi:hypothetical protein